MTKAIEAFRFYTLMDKVFRFAGSVTKAVEESWGALAERHRDRKGEWKAMETSAIKTEQLS
jgi:hypothetical protein